MCAHQRVIRTTRGSSFSMCTLAKTDPRFPKYPRIPVAACDGFAPADQADGGRSTR